MVNAHAKILEQLKNIYGLSASQLDQLVRNLTVRSIPKGQIVFHQGDQAKLVYLLLSGVASMSYNGDSRQTIVELFPSGEFFGLESLIDGARYSLQCDAFETSTIAFMKPRIFAEILLGASYQDCLPAVAAILRLNQESYVHCIRGIGLDLRSRIVLELSHLANHFGSTDARGILITLAISHETLASLVGASRQQVTEYLNELDKEKIIFREGRKIIINPKNVRKVIERRL